MKRPATQLWGGDTRPSRTHVNPCRTSTYHYNVRRGEKATPSKEFGGIMPEALPMPEKSVRQPERGRELHAALGPVSLVRRHRTRRRVAGHNGIRHLPS